MSFAAAAATRRFGHIARASIAAASSVFQPHPILAAQIHGGAFDSPSSHIVDFAGSNDAESGSFNATAGLKSVLKRTSTVSNPNLVSTSGRTTNRVVIRDPGSCDFVEIPTCHHLDDPHFEYYQATRMNYARVIEQSKEYKEAAVEVCSYWLKPENFQMLSMKNKGILTISWPQFYLTLPERDDVVDFNMDCKADRANYARVIEQNQEYEDVVVEVCSYWLKPENFQMLSLKNQRILMMKWPEFLLTLPEYNDVVDFNIDCKADRAVWRERQANQQPIEPIVNENDDLALEFERDAGTDSVTTDTTDECPSNDAEPIGNEAEEIAEAGLERAVVDGVETDFSVVTDSVTTDTTDECPSNDAEPIGNEAEEIAEAGLERAVVDGVETDFPVVAPRSKNARMLKELGCTLDGAYWSANGPRIRRKPDRFSPAM